MAAGGSRRCLSRAARAGEGRKAHERSTTWAEPDLGDGRIGVIGIIGELRAAKDILYRIRAAIEPSPRREGDRNLGEVDFRQGLEARIDAEQQPGTPVGRY